MFVSDNTTAVCPEIFDFLAQELQGSLDLPYGDDYYSQRLNEQVSEIFATECTVVPLVTGTAANCIGLAQLCRDYQRIICHPDSHLAVSESNAPQFFSGGGGLIHCAGKPDKICAEELQTLLTEMPEDDIHSAPPAVTAITQATESGSIYTQDEMQVIGDICRQHQLHYFVDGARFANAVSALNCHPADISWRRGVTAMTLGAGKNGAFNVEALVVFEPEMARGLMARVKRSGHLTSKMRFLSAQLMRYFDNNLWLKNAGQANAMAALCADLLAEKQIEIRWPAETNQLFIALSANQFATARDAGFGMYHWPLQYQDELRDYYRLVTNWSTTETQIRQLCRIL